MVLKRDFIVPGLEEISSDSESDEEVKFLDDSSKNIQDYEIINIDDDMSDDDLKIVGVEDKRERLKVWRNIIQCDLLDQRIKEIGLSKLRVNRDVESYDLPLYKLRKRRPKYFRPRRRRPVRSRLKMNVVHISSSDEESSENHTPNKIQMKKPLIVEDDDMKSLSEDSSDSESEQQPIGWDKFMSNIEQSQFQIEFASGREAVAKRIARELQEPKIDLIDRCLIYLGLEKCQAFLASTKEIENNGGMTTRDGYRRRTAGGVFLTLIKSDRTIDRSIKEQIFIETEQDTADNESLWWRSFDQVGARRRAGDGDIAGRRQPHNFSRRKNFTSYTFIDLDYFEAIKDFRYRFVPILTSFPSAFSEATPRLTTTLDEASDDCEIIPEDENCDDVVAILSDDEGRGHW